MNRTTVGLCLAFFFAGALSMIPYDLFIWNFPLTAFFSTQAISDNAFGIILAGIALLGAVSLYNAYSNYTLERKLALPKETVTPNVRQSIAANFPLKCEICRAQGFSTIESLRVHKSKKHRAPKAEPPPVVGQPISPEILARIKNGEIKVT